MACAMRALPCVLLALAVPAYADTTASPAHASPGDPVVVKVTGAAMPKGKAGGQPLQFFAAKDGYEAVFAVPLDINEDHVLVEVTNGDKPLSVAVDKKTFPESKVIVEEEMANPPAADRKLIDADNAAMGTVYALADGPIQFSHAFKRPPGSVTSTFGELRTFNDGHRSQHLGTDFGVSEGAKVGAITDGTVTLVRSTFLAGNVVIVGHGGGISSLYFHLSKPLVAVGDKVKAGQPIGLAGHTGRTTGPHLHLSVRVPGALVDPVAFLKLAI